MFLDTSYAAAREWCLACIGTSDPCPGQRRRLEHGLFITRFKCKHTLADACFLCCIPTERKSFGHHRPLLLLAVQHRMVDAVRVGHLSPRRVSHPVRTSTWLLGLPTHVVALDLSDAENKMSVRPRPLLTLRRAFYALHGRLSIGF